MNRRPSFLQGGAKGATMRDKMRQTRSRRIGVSLVFFANGAVFASWVPHIPGVAARLHLNEAALGLALLCLAAGAMTSLSAAGRLIGRFGSRTVTRAAGAVFCLALPLPVLAPSPLTLALALALFGMANGAMDVAMNDQAVLVEKEKGSPIMSSFHGLFSLGGLAGSALGGAVLAAGVSPLVHVCGATAGLGAVCAAGLARLAPSPPEGASGKSPFALPDRRVWPLCLLALLTLACEGAMADWTSVYLSADLAAGPGLAASGYAAFSLAMAAGRFAGDRLTAALGPVRLARASALLACAGLAAAVAAPFPLAAAGGFALTGLGLSNLIPLLFSAAGRTPGVAPGQAIAGTAAAGYMGFLIGPPVIGFTAGLTSLRVSLAGLALCAALTAALSRLLDRPALDGEKPAPGLEATDG